MDDTMDFKELLPESRSSKNAEVIQDQYRRLDGTWRHMHEQVTLWMVLFAAVLEIAMFFLLHGMDIITTSARHYSEKYVLAPLCANAVLVAVSSAIQKSRRVSERCRIYAVSITVALCCFVLYTVHAFFPALYLIFAIPMMLTVVYADWRLTTVVAALCIAGKAASDLFLIWDTYRAGVLDSRASFANFMLSLVILVLFYSICLFMIRIERAKNNVSIELEEERQRLEAESVTDPLTGVGNRQALRLAFDALETSGEAYCLAKIDLDRFKMLNDTCGHTCGDACLAALGGLLLRTQNQAALRAFRFGGDEFCILFRGGAGEAERLCREIQDSFARSQAEQGKAERLTLSIGLADSRAGERPFDLLRRADRALYEAKRRRNCVCTAAD
jgi:diguanylate cyclase